MKIVLETVKGHIPLVFTLGQKDDVNVRLMRKQFYSVPVINMS